MTSTTNDFTERARAALAKTAAKATRHVIGYHHQALDNKSDDAVGVAHQELGGKIRGVREGVDGPSIYSLRGKIHPRGGSDHVTGDIFKDKFEVLYDPRSHKHSIRIDTGLRDNVGRVSPSSFVLHRSHTNVSPSHLRAIGLKFGRDIDSKLLAKALNEVDRHRSQLFLKRRVLPAVVAGSALLAGAGYLMNRNKTAALNANVRLQPHQADAVVRAQSSPGLVLNWGLGSGKTLGALAMAEAKGGNVLAVVPASLRENFRQQLREHVSPLRQGAYTVISYDEFRRDPGAWVTRVEPTTLIADEFHRLRNPAPREPFELVRGRVKFMIGLTGSLVANRPEEMVPLVNLAAGSKVLGGQEEFKRRFITRHQIQPGIIGRVLGVKPGVEEEPRNLKELGRLTAPYVHRFTGSDEFRKHVPAVSEKTVPVAMDPRQEQMMRSLSSANPILAFKLRHNLPPSKKELTNMNAFMSAARQISNQPSTFDVTGPPSPKFKAMLDDIVSGVKRDKNFKAVIYSNFIDSGVGPLVAELGRRKIPAAAFTGALTDSQRRVLVADFNAGRIKVLGLTPAGGEGLDLKGVKLVQLTEEHWNPERGRQAVGRSARFRSHAHLPETERAVEVRRYQAVHNPRIWNRILGTKPPTSADQWIDARRQEKAELNAKFTDAVPEFDSRP